LIHGDVSGPYRVPLYGKKSQYAFLLLDDATRFLWLFLLLKKGDVDSCMRMFWNMVKTQFNVSIKRFRADGAFKTKQIAALFSEFGTVPEFTVRYSSSSNGRAERKIYALTRRPAVC
jgi:hypothetical protein